MKLHGQRCSSGVGRINSMKGPIKMDTTWLQRGTQGSEKESWKTKDQMVRCLKEDSWWTMDTRDMNPVAMEKHPKEMPTGIGTSTSPGLTSLTGFLANSFKTHSVVALCIHPNYHKVCFTHRQLATSKHKNTLLPCQLFSTMK
jgi:hypothetical protein